MARNASAIIDLDALRANYELARRLSGARAIAVVKADAYGHGAVAAAKALDSCADAFGVAAIEEALELREAGIRSPIMLLEGCFEAAELDLVDRHQLMIAIHRHDQLEALLRARPSRPIPTWIKLDTGMHRLGFHPEEAGSVRARLADCPHATDLVMMTHFARADEVDCEATAQQIRTFEEATQGLALPRSLANSAGILGWPQAHGDWIRPGIMLYGGSPFPGPQAHAAALRPVMTLTSEIIGLRDLQAGEPIGYGARYRCDRPTRVGVVAMGYGDGYPRSAADGTPVAVDGRRTRLIGRVSMDMLTVDCTDIPEVAIGSKVELWGSTVSVNEVAAHCDTISYELLTRRPGRVTRSYVGGPLD